MEEKYGTPWVEYNFFGPTMIEKSLREIAGHFDDTIKAKAEQVIAKYKPLMQAVIDKYKRVRFKLMWQVDHAGFLKFAANSRPTADLRD
jgi:nitrogenase molybdenum-iron protein alpha/beta subunit